MTRRGRAPTQEKSETLVDDQKLEEPLRWSSSSRSSSTTLKLPVCSAEEFEFFIIASFNYFLRTYLSKRLILQ